MPSAVTGSPSGSPLATAVLPAGTVISKLYVALSRASSSCTCQYAAPSTFWPLAGSSTSVAGLPSTVSADTAMSRRSRLKRSRSWRATRSIVATPSSRPRICASGVGGTVATGGT